MQGAPARPRPGSLPIEPSALVAALRSPGYLRLQASEQVREVNQRVFEEADRFFSLPLDSKEQSSLEPAMEGYRGYASEYCEVEERPDLCESFWFHHYNRSRAQRDLPASGRPLYDAMASAAEFLDRVVTDLVAAIEGYYWQTAPREPQFQTRYGSHLQLNYYQPASQPRAVLLDPHEDGLLFTLLQSTSAGLEVRTRDGRFVPVETRPGELLVMPGEIATLLSGGEIEPLYHRVRRRPGIGRRMSLMYFSNPNASRTRKLKPWRQTPANRDVDIMQRVIENPLKFGLPPIPVIE